MNTRQSYTVAAGATQAVTWYGDGGWYDASIRDANDPNFLRRVAGCVQTQSGTLLTDSAIGNTSKKFVAALASQAVVRHVAVRLRRAAVEPQPEELGGHLRA